jgi:hypothetical protein
MGLQLSCDICGGVPFLYIEYTNLDIKKHAEEYPLEKDGNPFPPLEYATNLLYKKNIKDFQIYREGGNIKIYQIRCKKCSHSPFVKSLLNMTKKWDVKIYKLSDD